MSGSYVNCLCEKSSTPWVPKSESTPFSLPITFKSYQKKGYPLSDEGKDAIQNTEWKQKGTVHTTEECRNHTIREGGTIFGIRTSDNTCWVYTEKFPPSTGWTGVKWATPGEHYVECVDKTKKPEDYCK